MKLLSKAVCQENEVFTTREELETVFSGVGKDRAGQLNIKEVLASSKAANMVKEAENCATTKSSGQKRLRSFYTFVGLEDFLEGPHFNVKGPKCPPSFLVNSFVKVKKSKDNYLSSFVTIDFLINWANFILSSLFDWVD